jgi:alkanesulfonate monooxygenase SsuD/methylene tetrahydromethanopterin reductase-like flavin-dependent oxidoreductase (luciferase family)
MLRYAMRLPAEGAVAAAYYAAAVEQASWADELGLDMVHMSEHHGADDGYCPSPLSLAAGIATRTRRIEIECVLILPFYELVHLAEEVAVVDLLSAGRLTIVAVAGYRPSEYAMFGLAPEGRAAAVDDGIRFLRQAWTGGAAQHGGRTVRVTPLPSRKGGPRLLMGGSTRSAARRAARLGVPFFPNQPGLWEIYDAECRAAGTEVGPRPPRTSGSVFVSEDPDRTWAQLAPFALHENNSYADWLREGRARAMYEWSPDAESLRQTGRYVVLTPDECATFAATQETLMLDPLMGGMPPSLGWESLELFARRVLPKISGQATSTEPDTTGAYEVH